MNIAGQLQQIAIFLHKNASIAALEEMPNPIVSPVKIICISSIQIVQDSRQLSPRGFEKQMVMVGH